MSEHPTWTGQPDPAQEGTLGQGRAAAREVAGTAKDRTAQVAEEGRERTRRAADELRDRVRAQSEHQSRRAAQSLRQWSEDLSAMHEHAKPDSPVRDVVHRVAGQGQRAADYLERHGLAGVVGEVQSFARRRPAAFLAGALAAGFLAGRVIKASGEDTGPATRPADPYSPLTGDTMRAAPEPVATPEPPRTTTGDPLGRAETRPVPPLPPPRVPPTHRPGSDLP